ncbi:zinc-dependent alcohol dehydrogenase [Streptomyces aculeolatus]
MTDTPMPIARTMRALVLEDFGRLVVAERPVPRPGTGEALVRVLATGICGSDVHGYTGENGRRAPGQVMGHETVGRVVALGTGATGVDAGDVVVLNPVLACLRCAQCQENKAHLCPNRRVVGVDPTLSSAFADYLVVPAANLVPFHARPLHGALVEPLAVGFHAARRGDVDESDRVLVLGGGPIGQAVAVACGRLGAASVTVSEPVAARRTLLAGLGVHPLDPTTADVVTATLELVGARPTVVIDAVGSRSTLGASLAATAPGGRCVLVGMDAPRIDLDAFAVSTFERSIVGSFCYPADEFTSTADWASLVPDLLDSMVSRTVAPDEAPDAFAALAARQGPAGKILVVFDET